MNKLLISFLLLLSILVVFPRNEQPTYHSLTVKFQVAEKLFVEAKRIADQAGDNNLLLQQADARYMEALKQFNALLPQATAAGFDSLALFTSIRCGYIHHLFDSSGAALANYQLAFSLKKGLPAIADSFLFSPLLFTGGIYYNRNEFDSAIYYYKKAEEINDRYNGILRESQRLYNRLGVLLYESGDYRQARNYFEKAISTSPPSAVTLKANYRMNIASLLVKLEELQEAETIYKELLRLNVFTNEINHNLGIISLKQKRNEEAIAYFNKVNYDDKKNTDLFLNKAMAYNGIGEQDSANQYLHRALAENLRWNGQRKNAIYGLILKYQGDLFVEKGKYREALPYYQQAIMQFNHNFTDSAIHSNPVEFTTAYSYINLFNTITAKAAAQKKIFERESNPSVLEAALNCYRSAFLLAEYVERTYTSDEARLFIGKIKHAVHNEPIETGLKLFRITNRKEYLEDVYFFDQRNKASLLLLNLQFREVSMSPKMNEALFQKENSLKTAITRLSLKASPVSDNAQLLSLKNMIRDHEIELNKTREEIASTLPYHQLQSAEKIPTIRQLHRNLDNTTAILSFHLSDEQLLVLVITAGRFQHFEIPVGSKFFSELEKFRIALHSNNTQDRFTGTDASTWLYREILSPVLPSLRQVKRLLIIPDDELHYLPFEALQDANNNYLFQKFAIQYQYSTAFLGSNLLHSNLSTAVSFAPFSKYGYKDSVISQSQLPASAGEMSLTGMKTLEDTAATKNNFFLYANRNKVVHLATHAAVDNKEPLNSWISFYPGNHASRLYAREIYDMQLDTTNLIVLSACETGTGQLVKGEGLMSLSRAFAYAGCPNIITSLWKAEDKTTAFIIQRLYYYLEKKETKDRALQLAKTDFLNNPEISPSLKSPNYWAHLVLIGEYEPNHQRSNWPWVAISIVAILLGYYYLRKRNLPGAETRQA